LNIRELKIVDTEAINKITRESLSYNLDVTDTKKNILNILKNFENKIFVSEIDDQVIGFVHGQIYQTLYYSKMINVLGLAVLQGFQHQGIGTELLKRLENWAKEVGASGIRLNSGNERTDAHKFYEHLGYKKIKEQFNYKKFPL
jgi:ribosomal protein S18 acetylase RimI-like enzyme